MDGYNRQDVSTAIHGMTKTLDVMDRLEAYMTRRFHQLAMVKDRTPEQNTRIDELARTLRVLQGHPVDPAA